MKLSWTPNKGPQTAFLASTAREVLYGGAAGGGKTDAIVALPFSRVKHPKHRSIILRRTRKQLQEVIDRTRELYPEVYPGAEWRESESRWMWPSGAITQMGYAEHEPDIFAYKSFEYDMILFDELTSFTEKQYKFMFTRNRSKSEDLPPVMRGGTNPDDIGAVWVEARFVSGRVPFRVYDREVELPNKALITTTQQFIPAKVWDNPKLPHRDQYIAGIMEMDEEDAAAYLLGVWSRTAGSMFKKPLINVPAALKQPEYYVVRAMDYGWSDQTAIYWLVVYPDELIDVVGEVYVNQTTVDGLAAAIKKEEAELEEKFGVRLVKSPRWSVAGADTFNTQGTSAQSIASMFQERHIVFTEANTDRVAGWAQINRVLSRGSLRVWDGRAPNLVRTLPHLKRDPLKPSDIKKRQEDHPADSLRYGLMSVYLRMEALPEPEKPAANPNKDTEFDEWLRKQRSRGGWRDRYPGA